MRGWVIFGLILATGASLGLNAYLLDMPPPPPVQLAAAPCPRLPEPDFCDQFQQPSQKTKCQARVRV